MAFGNIGTSDIIVQLAGLLDRTSVLVVGNNTDDQKQCGVERFRSVDLDSKDRCIRW